MSNKIFACKIQHMKIILSLSCGRVIGYVKKLFNTTESKIGSFCGETKYSIIWQKKREKFFVKKLCYKCHVVQTVRDGWFRREVVI